MGPHVLGERPRVVVAPDKFKGSLTAAEAAANARAVVAFETERARIQWTKVELRDPVKAYNKVVLEVEIVVKI